MSPDINTISDVPKDYSLVTGDHERDHILEHAGITPEDYSHGSLFVKTGGGEYTDILFFGGNVPYLYKSVTRIL